jgi:hypothetical protein
MRDNWLLESKPPQCKRPEVASQTPIDEIRQSLAVLNGVPA